MTEEATHLIALTAFASCLGSLGGPTRDGLMEVRATEDGTPQLHLTAAGRIVAERLAEVMRDSRAALRAGEGSLFMTNLLTVCAGALEGGRVGREPDGERAAGVADLLEEVVGRLEWRGAVELEID